MKYLMMVKLDGNSEDARQYAAGAPPPEALQEAMGKLIGKMLRSGVLVGTGGLRPVADGAPHRGGGRQVERDRWAYIESKEVIGGYAILEVGSKKEALQWGEEFMQIHIDILGPSYVGELEIRQMADQEDGCKFAEQQPRRRHGIHSLKGTTMKYICLGYIAPNKFESLSESDRNAMLDECFNYDDVLRQNGHFAGGEALQGPATAATLRWQNGQVAVTDGPYAETRNKSAASLSSKPAT